MLTANEIRHRFLEYFKKHGHTEVASSSLIPRDDPSLLLSLVHISEPTRP